MIAIAGTMVLLGFAGTAVLYLPATAGVEQKYCSILHDNLKGPHLYTKG
jgi:hypothetical protein